MVVIFEAVGQVGITTMKLADFRFAGQIANAVLQMFMQRIPVQLLPFSDRLRDVIPRKESRYS